MPLYEYKCEGCGETFEVIQKFADQPLTVHEKCGGHVHKLMSAPSFQFKGTGWYVTDYAKGSGNVPSKGDSAKGEGSKGDSDSSKSDSSSKTDSSSKGSGDTATKTETKSESKPAAGSSSSKND